MMDVMKTLGENLHRVRSEKGLSRQELSVRLGISERDLEDIENGVKDVDTNLVYMLSEILGVKLDDLFESESSRNKLLNLIHSKLDTYSDKELQYIFNYMHVLLNKKS